MSPRGQHLNLLCALVLTACGPSHPNLSGPPTPSAPSEPAQFEPPRVAEARTPCEAAAPTRESLALGERGIVRIDARERQHLGSCISPALVLGPDEIIECDPTGLRCRVSNGQILIAREIEEDCVPVALVEPHDEPREHEMDAVIAGLGMWTEACALHELVTHGDLAFYGVERVRSVAPGRDGALAMECIQGTQAIAIADATRIGWSAAPMECLGLRCRHVDPHTGAVHWLFAHRVSGPLRFDAVAVGDRGPVLEQLKVRCR